MQSFKKSVIPAQAGIQCFYLSRLLILTPRCGQLFDCLDSRLRGNDEPQGTGL